MPLQRHSACVLGTLSRDRSHKKHVRFYLYMNNKNEEITIKKIAEIFLPLWWLVVSVALICAIVLGGASHFLTKDTYTAKSKYMVVKIPSTSTSTVVGLNSQEIMAMQSMIANAKEIISTPDFCDAVLDLLDDAQIVDLTVKHEAEIDDLQDLIDEKNTEIDSLTSKFITKVESLQSAGADVSSVVADYNDRYAVLIAERDAIDADIQQLKSDYDAKVAEFNDKPEDYVPYSSYVTSKMLMNMISITLSNSETTCYYLSVTTDDPVLSRDIALVAGTVLTEKFVGTGYAVKIDRLQTPLAPTSTDSKNEIRNALIGFALGAFATLLVIFVHNRFDVVIRNREKLEDNFDYPILAVIPRLENTSHKS